jgi:large-conductance mechanosensitive channel
VIGLAIAFIIGWAAGRLVRALVTNRDMPVIKFFPPRGTYQEAMWIVSPVRPDQLAIGHFAATIVDVKIIARRRIK